MLRESSMRALVEPMDGGWMRVTGHGHGLMTWIFGARLRKSRSLRNWTLSPQAAPSSKYIDLCPLNLPHPLTQKGQKGRPRYQMALEDAQLKHGDETQPIENPEAHLKAYRESVKIMK